jgi:ubiquitin-conjugating enzyme E2 variant
MFIYADVYSAVLHAFFDKEESVRLPALGKSAHGFQMHHDHPLASTRDQGLYRLFSDTVKAQWLAFGSALMLAQHTVLTGQLLVLKWLMCAYGTQLGHYWSHVHPDDRPLYVRILQRCHVLLPQKHHSAHHRPPYNKHFGIVSGLCNPVLDPVLRRMNFKALLVVWAVLTLCDVAILEALLPRLALRII